MLQPKQRNCRIQAGLGRFRMKSTAVISALSTGSQRMAKKGGFIPKGCSAHSSPQGSQCLIRASELPAQQTSPLCQLFVLGQPRHPRTSIRNSKCKTASQKGRIWRLSTAVERQRVETYSPASEGKIYF